MTAKTVLSWAVIAQVTKYKDQIDAINAAAPSMLTDEEKAAKTAENEASAATLRDAVLDFVDATMDLTPEEAGTILRIGLEAVGRPAGTCKNYGRAVAGFRKLAEKNPEGWRNATMREAQDAMRTAEQVKLDASREALRPYLKAAKLQQLDAILAFARELGITLPEKGKKKDGKPVADKPSHSHEQSKAA